MKKQHRNNRKSAMRSPAHRRHTQRPRSPLWAVLRSFFGGAATVALLLCAETLLFANTNLSLQFVRPAACGAASFGAFVTGLLASGAAPKGKLAAGFGAGIFYALCVLLSGLLTGGMPLWDSNNLSLLAALLLGGTAGGAAAALRSAPRTALEA